MLSTFKKLAELGVVLLIFPFAMLGFLLILVAVVVKIFIEPDEKDPDFFD